MNRPRTTPRRVPRNTAAVGKALCAGVVSAALVGGAAAQNLVSLKFRAGALRITEAGILRCAPGEDYEFSLEGEDASMQGVDLSELAPRVVSTDPQVMRAAVSSSYAHMVTVRCVSDGEAWMTAETQGVRATFPVLVGQARTQAGMTTTAPGMTGGLGGSAGGPAAGGMGGSPAVDAARSVLNMFGGRAGGRGGGRTAGAGQPSVMPDVSTPSGAVDAARSVLNMFGGRSDGRSGGGTAGAAGQPAVPQGGAPRANSTAARGASVGAAPASSGEQLRRIEEQLRRIEELKECRVQVIEKGHPSTRPARREECFKAYTAAGGLGRPTECELYPSLKDMPGIEDCIIPDPIWD